MRFLSKIAQPSLPALRSFRGKLVLAGRFARYLEMFKKTVNHPTQP